MTADPYTDLRDEVDRLDREFFYLTSTSGLLEELATPDDPSADVTFLNEAEAVRQAAAAAILQPSILETIAVPVEIDVPKRGALFVAGPIDARATTVNESRGFRVEGRRVTLTWTTWDFSLTADVTVSAHAGVAQLASAMKLRASLQLLVRTADDACIDAEVLAIRGVRPSELTPE